VLLVLHFDGEVKVFCDCQYLLGEILEVKSGGLKVSVMIHSLEATLKWPNH